MELLQTLRSGIFTYGYIFREMDVTLFVETEIVSSSGHERGCDNFEFIVYDELCFTDLFHLI